MLPFLLLGAAAFAAIKALSNSNKDTSNNSENSKYRSQQQQSKLYSDSHRSGASYKSTKFERRDYEQQQSKRYSDSPRSGTSYKSNNFAEKDYEQQQSKLYSDSHRSGASYKSTKFERRDYEQQQSKRYSDSPRSGTSYKSNNFAEKDYEQQQSKEYSDRRLRRNDLLSHQSNSVTASPISRTRVHQNYAESILTEAELSFATEANKYDINGILYGSEYFMQLSSVERKEYLSHIRTNTLPNLGEIVFYPATDFVKERCKTLLKQNQYIFSNGTFYIKRHIDNKGEESLLLYNDDIVLLLKNSINRGGVVVLLQVLQRGRDDRKIKGQKMVLSSKLTISNALRFRYYDGDYSSSINNYINYIDVKEQIRLAIKEISKVKREAIKEGRKSYDTILEYLKYQLKNEIAKEETSKKDAVTIVSCERNVRKDDKPTYTVTFNRDTTNYFDCENSESIYVRIAKEKDVESKKPYTAKLEALPNNQYELIFDSANINFDFLQSGVFVWQGYSVRHIFEQIKSVESFIEKMNDKSNFVLQLIANEVAKPEIQKYRNIDFYNKNIVREAEGGTQQNAVRMALGNSDDGLVLIQGPPGTGKTTVIVEIIQQLTKEHKRVLVCSQSNSAVENVEKKLKGLNIRGGVKRIPKDDRVAGDKDSQGKHKDFISTNQNIMILLKSDLKNEAEDLVRLSDYESLSRKYKEYHNNIMAKSSDMLELFECIKDEYKDFVENGSVSSSDLRDIEYLQYGVVLATCISAGLNINNKIFDTVIIDEAGKADLAETIVPIMLANRTVLVGDHKQLPPYMDREEITKFCEEPKFEIEDVQTIKSTSMFQLLHSQMPEECKCLLNYQFRMNEQIGRIVSDMFYDGDVMMGANIAQMNIEFDEPYNRPVVVVDTSSDSGRFDRSRNRSFYNTLEVDMIFKNILPKVAVYSTKSIGILTFYNEQRRAISQRLAQSNLRGNKDIEVCTLDSIQGREFDVVILSAVRSFSKNSNCSIGFISDMRRLNVALSRAKSKLIVVGDFSTLCNEKSYRNSLDTSAIKVFKRLSQEKIEYSKIDNTSLFKQKYKVGDVIEAVYNGVQRNRLNITIDKISFMICRKELKVNKQKGDSLIVKYIKDHNDKPIFIVEGEYLVRYATKFIKNNVTYIRPSLSEMPDISINFGQRINKKIKEDIHVNCIIDRSNGEVLYSIAECEISQLVEGEVIKGVVNMVEVYGLFVDIGTSKNGLIHISTLRDANELNSYHRGDAVNVVVNAIDYSKQRISLTLHEE